MFREASQNRIFEDVVQQIQDAILNGLLTDGDVLPSERDLRVMFNTSRGTLREALRVLEERGLIVIKLGVRGGATVRDVSTRHASETLALLIQSQKVSLNHLAEFREGIEGSVAYLAAQRATAVDVGQLRALIQEAEPCIAPQSMNRDAFLAVDKQFHLLLAQISGNPVYRFVLQSVHDNIHRYYDDFLSMSLPELQENFQDMCEIVRAVEKGSAETARVLAQSHIMRFNQHMNGHWLHMQEKENQA
ncbi:MAG: FadR/GntR family transcriptional regulator [Desulfosarcina sp.]